MGQAPSLRQARGWRRRGRRTDKRAPSRTAKLVQVAAKHAADAATAELLQCSGDLDMVDETGEDADGILNNLLGGLLGQ